MKTLIPLTYMGRCTNPDCPNPYHFVPVHAVLNTKELPERCHCGASIRWEQGVHRHNIQTLKKIEKNKRLKITVLIIAATLTVVGAVTAFYSWKIYQSHSGEEMATVIRQVKETSCAEILGTMVDAGYSEKRLSRLLDSYPSVIHRLRLGKTEATPQLESVLKEIYMDYLLTGSWSVVSVKYTLVAKPDPFLVGLHPLQEKPVE